MSYGDSSLRVVVSGIRKGPVRRYRNGIVEEDNLGYFFYDQGCAVAGVRLVIDAKRGDASRGFGFVDLEDEASLKRALALNGCQAPDLAGKDGCLRIEKARPASDEAKRKQLELSEARNQTEEMERDLAFRDARLNELLREVQRKRERQCVSQDLDEQLQAELRRQEAIGQALESLKVAEETLQSAMAVEQERTDAMEAIASCVDGEQTRRHSEEEPPGGGGGQVSFHLGEEDGRGEAGAGAFSPPPRAPALLLEDAASLSESLQVRVRNTFIEYWIPPCADHLVRTKTAPPDMFSSGNHSPQSRSHSSPGSGSGAQDAVAPWHASRGERTAPTGANEETSGALGKGCDSDGAPLGACAPWILKRTTSCSTAADVSRAILDEKMGVADATPPVPTAAAGFAGEPFGVAGPPTAAAVAMCVPRAPLLRRQVRLKNVPLVQADQLKTMLMAELARLWKAVRGRPPPVIDEFDIAERQGERTFAQIAAGTEVDITFADADDAAWLVDGRQLEAWSRAETLTLRGRMIQVEWTGPVSPDWRKLRYTADTDASSQISYGTRGTRQSFSSKIGECIAGGATGPDQVTGICPPRNRTVVLEGLPTSWPAHQVRDEVLVLLKKLWQRDGLSFDARQQLHHGGDGGVEVRPGRRRGEENGGTCLVRLRQHLDAKWLVEASGPNLTVGGGTRLRAAWARPRQGPTR